jgi:hypothetical protein
MNIQVPNPPYEKCNFPGCRGKLLPFVEPETGFRPYEPGTLIVPNTITMRWKCAYADDHQNICKHEQVEEKKAVFFSCGARKRCKRCSKDLAN